jgi:hypothetical protein
MDLINHNIVVWNPRGVNAPNRGTVVKTVVDDVDASIVCMVESKLAVVDRFTVMGVLGQRFDGFVALQAVGTAGGIIVAWQSSRVQVTHSQVDVFSVTITLQLDGGEPWSLTTVYGPTQDPLKIEFLNELRAIRAGLVGPWAVTGDFNLILEAADKNNSILHRRMMGRFQRLLNDVELKEQNLVGRRYTWSNERQSPTLEKLDRWFCSVDWDEGHPDCLLQARSSSLSDHCAIMLSTNVSFRRKSRFHFQSFWTSIEGFQEAVSAGWFSVEEHSNPFVDLSNRLRETAKVLTRWSQRRVGNLKEQILMANEVIFQLDRAMDRRVLNQDERWLRGQLKKKVLGLASLERTIAHQRSRIAWLQEGDANTAFFHSHASARRRKNHIFRLRRGNTLVTEPAEMCDTATEHFVELLGTPGVREHAISLQNLDLPPIDATELELPFRKRKSGK